MGREFRLRRNPANPRARRREARLTFHFDANLTRGLYAVEVNVVDPT